MTNSMTKDMINTIVHKKLSLFFKVDFDDLVVIGLAVRIRPRILRKSPQNESRHFLKNNISEDFFLQKRDEIKEIKYT